MKFTFLYSALLSLLISFTCNSQPAISGRALAEGFLAPPDSIQTTVYWYWVSGNINREGIVKDLEAMKSAGINRAFIGNIGLKPDQVPVGPVKLFSEEWWDCIHTALKKAGELGIEIGIFNCPGWSQAGGPWIEPQQSMRYLASSSTVVHGGKKLDIILDRPAGQFRDVRVLALPAAASVAAPIPVARIETSPDLPGAGKLTDGKPSTGAAITRGKQVAIDLILEQPDTVRSLTIRPARRKGKATCRLQAYCGNDFRTIRDFEVNRINPRLEVGFDPYAPVVIGLPEVVSDRFRLVFTDMNPGFAVQEIELSGIPRVERYPEKTLAKMHQTPLPYWTEYLWPQPPEVNDPSAVVSPDHIVDISNCLTGDRLVWDAPPGNWQVIRFGMLPTNVTNDPAAPEGRGPEVDKMTSDYLEHHFDSFLGEIMRRVPAEDRKTFKVVVADSYEVGGQNFTDTFLEDFRSHYGYEALPFLPTYNGIVVGSPEMSDRFLWDVRRMVADKLSYAHIGGLRKIAHRHGLTLWLENYGHWGFPGEFLQYGGQSDEVAGEYWSEGTLGDIENRAASSCAHIYGKRKVSAESFTAGGKAYSRHPAVMKQRGDRFFAEGINNTLLHVYISQPEGVELPGMNAWFGNEFNRNNTWFDYLDLFTVYLKRVNFMLQQGLNVADVCYFIGEDTPKMTGKADPPLPPGYQFDYINAEVILRDMTVRDGLLTLPHGTRYRLMVLPKLETMRPELLEKIERLVLAGGAILGPRPTRSPSLQNYPQADQLIRKTADKLWGAVDGVNVRSASYGRGMVMDGLTMEEALSAIGCPPDLEIRGDAPVHFGHRDLSGTQIYFISNQSENRVEFDAVFRIAGLQPEWWDAVSGSMRTLPAYTETDGRTGIPLRLEPLESAIIVFRSKGRPSPGGVDINFPETHILAEPDGPWTLTFQAGRRGPAKPVTVDRLHDLSLSANDSIRFFSGAVLYENTFTLDTLPHGARVLLNTGETGVMAKVKVNGQYAGGVWTTPYRVDITDHVRQGRNELQVEVANNWMNRLVGDHNLPEEQRGTWSPVDPWKADSTLQRSGLMGPVSIESIHYISQ